jgi:hypothetical protein
MKRSQFVSKKKESLAEVPRRKSLVGRTEEEAAQADDIVCELDDNCLLLHEYIPLENFRIRYRGNDFYLTGLTQSGDSLKVDAKAKVWHKPILPGDK